MQDTGLPNHTRSFDSVRPPFGRTNSVQDDMLKLVPYSSTFILFRDM